MARTRTAAVARPAGRDRGGTRAVTHAEPVLPPHLRDAPAARATRAISVFVVDDHAITRAGSHRMLEDAGGFLVVGEAADTRRALQGILASEPDLALVDVRLPGGDGIELIRELRSRRCPTRCIVLTTFPDEAAFFQAMVAGAAGFLLKDRPAEELVAACRQAADGRSLFAAEALDTLRSRLQRPKEEDPLLAQLTPQERRILQFVGEGMTNRQIAGRLGLAEKTVRNYVSNILTKMDMRNRTMAAAYLAQYAARSSADRATTDHGDRSPNGDGGGPAPSPWALPAEDGDGDDQEAVERLAQQVLPLLRPLLHDLRSPLGTARRLVAAIGDDDPSDADRRRMVSELTDSLATIETATVRAYALETLESRLREEPRARVDLARVVTDLVREDDHPDSPALRIDPGSHVVVARRSTIVAALRELLDNARTHPPIGTSVGIRVSAAGDAVVVSVEDDGPGVPASHRERIFVPFQRGAHDALRGGLGLGLAIVKRVSEAHGGRAWVEERRGGGAAFRVSLPRIAPATAD